MRIWVLTENTSCCDSLQAEHGLSLLIETKNHKILFDAGQSDAFLNNAERMRIDLRDVDFAILSHGHYDHGGGLKTFLDINDHAPVYLSARAFGGHYNADLKYIGLDAADLKRDRLVWTEDCCSLGEGLALYSCNLKDRPWPTESFGLTILENGELRPDDFLHEQYLLIEEEGKRILISGCSHKGILNIVHWFRPDVLIGGFHFMKLGTEGEDADRLAEAANQLLQYPAVYYTGHCTGEPQYVFMKSIMGDRLQKMTTGGIIEV